LISICKVEKDVRRINKTQTGIYISARLVNFTKAIKPTLNDHNPVKKKLAPEHLCAKNQQL